MPKATMDHLKPQVEYSKALSHLYDTKSSVARTMDYAVCSQAARSTLVASPRYTLHTHMTFWRNNSRHITKARPSGHRAGATPASGRACSLVLRVVLAIRKTALKQLKNQIKIK